VAAIRSLVHHGANTDLEHRDTTYIVLKYGILKRYEDQPTKETPQRSVILSYENPQSEDLISFE